MSIISQLESLLFVALKPITARELAKLVKIDLKKIEKTLEEMLKNYQEDDSGLILIKSGDKYQLATKPANAKLIQEFLKDEVSGELSQPSLEALTIIAYRGPIGKLELERIRGVNCSLILRNLLLRGLIEEKYSKVKDENYYSVTPEFVRFLGISDLQSLPDYEKLNNDPIFASIEKEEDLL